MKNLTPLNINEEFIGFQNQKRRKRRRRVSLVLGILNGFVAIACFLEIAQQYSIHGEIQESGYFYLGCATVCALSCILNLLKLKIILFRVLSIINLILFMYLLAHVFTPWLKPFLHPKSSLPPRSASYLYISLNSAKVKA